jgi:hypothetical protein
VAHSAGAAAVRHISYAERVAAETINLGEPCEAARLLARASSDSVSAGHI